MGLQFHTIVRNGAIQLPESMRDAVHNETKVIVTIEQEVLSEENDIFQSLFITPLKTSSNIPLTREEANKRR